MKNHRLKLSGQKIGLLTLSAALVALIAAPIAADAADLSSASFAVRAQHTQDSERTAVRPLFGKGDTATPTTPPAYATVYESDFSKVGSFPAEWQMQKDAAWQKVTVIEGASGRPNSIGQNAFPYNGELRFKLSKQLDPGDYSVSFKYNLDKRVGSVTAPPYWSISINGTVTKLSVPYSPGDLGTATFDGIKVPSGGASEILIATGKGSAGNFNLYTIAGVKISKKP